MTFCKLKNFPLNDNISIQGNFFLKVPQLSFLYVIYLDFLVMELEKKLHFIFFQKSHLYLLFHTCRRQETNISSPEGLFMSDSAVYYFNKINL
jgi:hypothetical protein